MSKLHFRNKQFKVKEVIELFEKIIKDNIKVESLSLSYNPIGDEGAMFIAKHIPDTLKELGLVGCKITNLGGQVLIKSLKVNKQITMLCIEGNHFSQDLKMKFSELGKERNILVVV